ncbi:MAG: hypothetical protein CMJ69_21430 [Planctomycetaceae bacterium]|nr:hypothetical protein [Planctomycetaceae bacterium]
MRDQHSNPPKVRLAKPSGRPFQVRWTDPETAREVRVSAGTHDRDIAERQKQEIEAQLLLGVFATATKKKAGPQMSWDDFRDEYSRQKLTQLRPRSASDAENRLDIVERIASPRTLGDMVDRDTLDDIQSRLLAGESSRHGRPRSPHTVRSQMAVLFAALNWAALKGWTDPPPKILKIKTSKLRAMRGRPLTGEEFDRLLAVVPTVVGDDAAQSWRFLLRGLWESALRIGEAMHLHWTDANEILPQWRPRRLPTLSIPAALQKNDVQEEIPLLPGFESLLLSVPEDRRTGWVFDPESLQPKYGRPAKKGRATAEWVSRVIGRFGKRAGIIVQPFDDRTGRPAKTASAHDLRRSAAERMLDAGVPPRLISRVLRHASWETTRRHYAPGDVQRDAEALRAILDESAGTVPRYSDYAEST